jgi:hypothetical protein
VEDKNKLSVIFHLQIKDLQQVYAKNHFDSLRLIRPFHRCSRKCRLHTNGLHPIPLTLSADDGFYTYFDAHCGPCPQVFAATFKCKRSAFGDESQRMLGVVQRFPLDISLFLLCTAHLHHTQQAAHCWHYKRLSETTNQYIFTLKKATASYTETSGKVSIFEAAHPRNSKFWTMWLLQIQQLAYACIHEIAYCSKNKLFSTLFAFVTVKNIIFIWTYTWGVVWL